MMGSVIENWLRCLDAVSVVFKTSFIRSPDQYNPHAPRNTGHKRSVNIGNVNSSYIKPVS